MYASNGIEQLTDFNRGAVAGDTIDGRTRDGIKLEGVGIEGAGAARSCTYSQTYGREKDEEGGTHFEEKRETNERIRRERSPQVNAYVLFIRTLKSTFDSEESCSAV